MDKDLEQRDVSEWLAEHALKWEAMSPEEQKERKAANLAEREKYNNMSIHEIIAECDAKMSKSAGKPGWKYKDLPRMVPELFYKFIEIVGQENLHWLAVANYGDTLRGQVLISPDGMEILRKFNDKET